MRYHFYVEKVVNPPRARTIVVNSTEANSDLYVVGTNNYRYTGDDEVYMLFVQVSGSSTHFVNGMNVIIVPRYIALDSKFNDILTSAPSSTGMGSGQFYTTDLSKSSSSSNIAAVISTSASISSSAAETLLTRLTQNTTGAQVANSVAITQNNLYTLGLPSDVLSRISYALNSDPLGNAPDYLTFSGIVGAIVDMLITFGTSLINLAENLVKVGLKLLSYTAAAINTAVAAISRKPSTRS